MSYIFISYSRKDVGFVYPLVKILKQEGYDIFIDRTDLVGGTEWLKRIEDAIKECDTIILVLSSNSMKEDSFVKKEWQLAFMFGKKIVPIKLSNRLSENVSTYLKLAQIIDFHITQQIDYEAKLKELFLALGEPPKKVMPKDIEVHTKLDAILEKTVNSELSNKITSIIELLQSTKKEEPSTNIIVDILDKLIDEFNLSQTYLEISDFISRLEENHLISEKSYRTLNAKLIQNNIYHLFTV